MTSWFDKLRGKPEGASEQTAKALRKSRGVPIGEWNHMIGIYAPRGYGKSTEAVKIALRLQKEGPAYVIAHDAGFRVPSRTHDGVSLGVRRHETLREVRAALAGPYPDGVHAVGGQRLNERTGKRETITAGDVIELALEVADASKLAAARAAGLDDVTSPTDPRLEGVPAIPVVVIIDEAVLAEGASKHRIDPRMSGFLISLRHHHVALVYTAQGGNMIHYEMLNQATEVWLGRATHARALKAYEDAGIPKDVVEDLPTMPKFEFHHVIKD